MIHLNLTDLNVFTTDDELRNVNQITWLKTNCKMIAERSKKTNSDLILVLPHEDKARIIFCPIEDLIKECNDDKLIPVIDYALTHQQKGYFCVCFYCPSGWNCWTTNKRAANLYNI
ncbi:MAG TPA: hypothetical protein VF868_15280 [Bacteroidia bacterium]|jgi:hypothetical protein